MAYPTALVWTQFSQLRCWYRQVEVDSFRRRSPTTFPPPRGLLALALSRVWFKVDRHIEGLAGTSRSVRFNNRDGP